MCSVLIFTKPDNDHEDPTLDWQKFKCGDVVDISEFDNFHWGDAIQGPNAIGWWSVVVVTAVQKAQLAHLLESGPMPFVTLVEQNPSEVKHQKRLWSVDVSPLSAEMSLDSFMATVTAKPSLTNLNLIG